MHKKAMLAVAATVVMLFVAMTVQRHGIETQLTVYGQRYENAERDLEDEKNSRLNRFICDNYSV